MDATSLPFLAIATIATLAVLAYVLRPLWIGGARAAVAGLVAGLALATLSLYALVGTPLALDPVVREAPRTLEAAIAQLQAQLQREPQSVEGWRLLGRAQASAGEAGKARDAYAEAARLAPEEPDVLVEAAEARALAADEHRFDARGLAWLQHALELQPSHQRARWFLGIAQRQAGDAAAAARTWEPLLAQVDPRTAAPLREQIALARSEAGLPPLPDAPAAVTGGRSVQVRVSLEPALAPTLSLDGNARVFVVARAPNLNDGLFEPFGLSGVTLRIADVQTDDVLNACDAVITASGTATVQTALHGKPMVVIYKLSPTTYRLGKGLAKVDMYAMVNLIAGRRIVTELIQDDCTPEAVAKEAVRILTDRACRDEMIVALEDVRRQLGGPGASDRAADAVLDVIHSSDAP